MVMEGDSGVETITNHCPRCEAIAAAAEEQMDLVWDLLNAEIPRLQQRILDCKDDRGWQLMAQGALREVERIREILGTEEEAKDDE